MIYEFKLGSLFSGIGGFDVAFKRAGFSIPWMSEVDIKCQNILRKHFPESKIFGDIKLIKTSDLSPVDVVTFGSPCQDLSHAGKRLGISGSRSSLFFEAIRIINDINPNVIIWENVTGALTSNNGNDFLHVINKLSQNGRNVSYRVLDSKYFGVPQRRRRVFVVSCIDGIDSKKILKIDQDMNNSCISSNLSNDFFSIQDIRPIIKKQNGKGWSDENISYTLDTKSTQGFAYYDNSTTDIGKLRAIVRKITPTEAERLQGFPDGWTLEGRDEKNCSSINPFASRMSQLGNAVTVNVAEWIAKNAKEELLQNRHILY
jgi:DNA (cytosine-5)-methyltransferase 1